jgi:hypothetical protein
VPNRTLQQPLVGRRAGCGELNQSGLACGTKQAAAPHAWICVAILANAKWIPTAPGLFSTGKNGTYRPFRFKLQPHKGAQGAQGTLGACVTVRCALCVAMKAAIRDPPTVPRSSNLQPCSRCQCVPLCIQLLLQNIKPPSTSGTCFTAPSLNAQGPNRPPSPPRWNCIPVTTTT